MSLTGQQLLVGFSDFLGDSWSSTTTSAGASDGTTLVDTLLERVGDDALVDWYVRFTDSGSNQYLVRRISDFGTATGTCTFAPGFAAQVASAKTYELHQYDPVRKFAALDEAAIALSNRIPLIVYDETITLDGQSLEFTLPTTIRKGPVLANIEDPLPADVSWNFLSNPRGNTLTNWTTAGGTSAIYTGGDWDNLIPKYDATCTHITVPLTTLTTHRQTVSVMSHVTAANASGRRMVASAWVYSRTSARVRVEFLDANGQVAQSALHQGKGWELLVATGTVSAGNTTTLTFGITVSSGAAMECYVNNSWFFYGDQMPSYYPLETSFYVPRDEVSAKILLPNGMRHAYARRQLRLVGAGPLSALGTVAATQATATVEVDAYTATVLYAKAAQILLGEGLAAHPRYNEMATAIKIAESRLEELERQWTHQFAKPQKIKGVYS